MSEIINNSESRKALLKHMILELHKGEAPDLVRKRLVELLRNIPYNEVVEVEQELISEGLPEEEVLKFCDIHTYVLEGHIDQTGARPVPEGHPVDTFSKENIELNKVAGSLKQLLESAGSDRKIIKELFLKLHGGFNELMDVDKHYKRKEYLVFPFLEKYGITGPPKVMWGKHDEIRQKLGSAMDVFTAGEVPDYDELSTISELILLPAINSVLDMIMKEEEILFPMCMDTLSEEDWYEVYKQTPEFGFCLYDPSTEWNPGEIIQGEPQYTGKGSIQLDTGSFSLNELNTLFTTLPVDITFVDKDDKVKFYSHGPDRIFARNRAILGRDVRMCHPPGSVNVVEQILNDFKSGKENSAAFWINIQGRFIYIEYFAMRDKDGNYSGTVEVTQDLTRHRKLEGEQRLLSYTKK